MVTAGFPLPGWSVLAEEPPPPPPPLLSLSSSLPQPTAAASMPVASSAISRRVNRVDMGGPSSVFELGGRGRRVGGRHDGLELLGQHEAARRDRALNEAEEPVHGEGEHDDDERRRDHPDEVIRRLVDDDVAEA